MARRFQRRILGDNKMEKLFWGMVGGCTVAFAILLGMYLNKTGVIGAEPETSTEVVSEIGRAHV